MMLKNLYPDPFVGGDACPVTCDLTLGPCFADSPVRADISEGARGVPVRLALRITEHLSCAAVTDAVVDVWHCGTDGLYTGDDAHPACRQNEHHHKHSVHGKGPRQQVFRGHRPPASVYSGFYHVLL